MIEKLKQLQNNAYAPYSNFYVSACVVMKDGKEFYGVNVEDASSRAGTCAERCAIFSAITAGYKKNDFKEIHILVSSGEISMPCFVCRQLLVEFFEPTSKVYCYALDGKCITHTISELCPYPFLGDDLK